MNILAIGGGQKEPMLRTAISDVDNPEVLIVPTACSTEKSYDRKVKACRALFDRIGVPKVVLHEFDQVPTVTQIDHEFGAANMLFVIGGNTPHLMRKIDEHGTDTAIADAVNRGVLLSGSSAGAILPFKEGFSCPVPRPEEEPWDFEFVPALGLLRAAVSVHANVHDPTPLGDLPETRLDYFIRALQPRELGIGIDKGAALYIQGDEGSVLRSDEYAQVYIAEPSEIGHVAAPILDPKYMNSVVSRIIDK